MRILAQSTARNIMVFMADSADHISGKSGLTLTITASKDGAAFATITPTVTDRGDGWYKIALTTSHTDTLGDLALIVSGGTGSDTSNVLMQVIYDSLTSEHALESTAADALANTNDIVAKTDLIGASVALETGGYLEDVKDKTDLIGASVALETGGNLASIKATVDSNLDAPITGRALEMGGNLETVLTTTTASGNSIDDLKKLIKKILMAVLE